MSPPFTLVTFSKRGELMMDTKQCKYKSVLLQQAVKTHRIVAVASSLHTPDGCWKALLVRRQSSIFRLVYPSLPPGSPFLAPPTGNCKQKSSQISSTFCYSNASTAQDTAPRMLKPGTRALKTAALLTAAAPAAALSRNVSEQPKTWPENCSQKPGDNPVQQLRLWQVSASLYL